MPFFRELSGKAKQRNVPLVVVSPESLDIVQRYAAHHDLTAESIVSFQGKGVPTPTLVLVSPDGVMQTVWVGRQTPDGERRIFEALDAVS